MASAAPRRALRLFTRRLPLEKPARIRLSRKIRSPPHCCVISRACAPLPKSFRQNDTTRYFLLCKGSFSRAAFIHAASVVFSFAKAVWQPFPCLITRLAKAPLAAERREKSPRRICTAQNPASPAMHLSRPAPVPSNSPRFAPSPKSSLRNSHPFLVPRSAENIHFFIRRTAQNPASPAAHLSRPSPRLFHTLFRIMRGKKLQIFLNIYETASRPCRRRKSLYFKYLRISIELSTIYVKNILVDH